MRQRYDILQLVAEAKGAASGMPRRLCRSGGGSAVGLPNGWKQIILAGCSRLGEAAGRFTMAAGHWRHVTAQIKFVHSGGNHPRVGRDTQQVHAEARALVGHAMVGTSVAGRASGLRRHGIVRVGVNSTVR